MTTETIEYRPQQFRRLFVQDVEHLRETVAWLEQSSAIGVDAEMVQRVERKPGGYQDWTNVLALIQVASDDLSVVVDPVRCRDLSGLKPLMEGRARKVFLGGGQDGALLEKAGIAARNVVDVGEVALAVFGRREDGMATLASRIFDVSLDKTIRRTDWLVRPLDPTLVAYAHRDAELTLLIYRWFQANYPKELALHERGELDPVFSLSVPAWLREATRRSSSLPQVVLAEHGLDAERDKEQLSRDVGEALRRKLAPRQINRLLRLAADLDCKSVATDVTPFAASPSSLIRASAARALGQLAEPAVAEPVLDALKDDPIEDVRKAVEAALRNLRKPKKVEGVAEDEQVKDLPSLGEGALSALDQLREQLEGGGVEQA